MGKILLHCDQNLRQRYFAGLIAYLEAQGHEVHYVRQFRLPLSLDYHHAFLAHGLWPTQLELTGLLQRFGVPYTIAEIGFFPQRDHFFFDSKGINAASALMEDDLSWVGPRQLERYREFREAYAGGHRHTGKNRYVFCPLQLAGDSNIQLHSPFKTMQAFIDHAERTFPGEPIVFKRHPKDPCREYRVSAGNTLLHDGDLHQAMSDARLVYGINSTALYEAVMQGVPTVAVGEGLLKRHHDQQERLLAALVDQQISVNERDYGYWLRRYANPFLPDGRRDRHALTLVPRRLSRMFSRCV
jgi:hypothetical protein